MKTIPHETDDRVLCDSCAMFRKSRSHGTIKLRWCVALATSAHPKDVRVRCRQFMPQPDDPDQRTGMQRWPTLEADIEWCRRDTKKVTP
jgi:hypothetical protein